MLDERRVVELARLVAGQADAGADVDDILRRLREQRLSFRDSTRVLVEAGLCSPGDAIGIVYRSPVWADVRDVNEALQAELFQEIENERTEP